MRADTVLLAFPGINTVTPTFLCGLVDMSARHGWDPNGIALVISEESSFNPAAKNPHSTASGLIQFIEPTAASLGTTTAQIRATSAEQQLPLVERFFATSLNGKIPARIEDYFLAVLGRPDLIGQPDTTTVFAKGSSGYAGNPQIDLDKNGVITVGDARAYMQNVLNRAQGTVVVSPSICYETLTPPTSTSNAGLVAVAVGLIALVGGVGYSLFKVFDSRAPEPEFDPRPARVRRVPF